MEKVRHSIHRKKLSSLILRVVLAAAPLGFPVGLSADLSPVWTFNAADGIHSSPCLGHDGTIYFVTAGNVKLAEVIALTSDANIAKWTSATNFSITGPVESSLVLTRDDATLYVTAADGVLRAVNTTNGTLRWQFPTAEAAPLGAIHTAPAIGVDGTVYYATEVRDIHKMFHWYLEALNPDGTEKWEWPTDFAAAPSGRVLSNPAVGADGTLYVATANGSSSGVFAFTDAGTGASQKWTYPATTIQIGEIHSNLVIDGDGTIYFGTHAGTETNGVPHLWAINPDGTFKWFFPSLGGSFDSSPAFGLDGTIYLGSDEWVATDGNLVLGTVYAVSPADGSPKWSFTNPNQAPPGTQTSFASSPAVAADDTIYIGSGDTRVYALTDRGTRPALEWQSTQSGTTPGADQATGFESSPIITANGHMVYIGSWDHNLYVFSQTNNGPARSFWPMWGANRRHSANAQDNRWSDSPPPVATILDLGTFDMGSAGSEADAINDRDNVVGNAEGNYFGTAYDNVFYYGVSTPPLGSDNLTPSILYGAMTAGLAINFRNVVVGYATGSNGQHAKQWTWSGRAWQQENLAEAVFRQQPWVSGFGDRRHSVGGDQWSRAGGWV
ncbi:MAG: outer membrane protein assembly factor BamB family protein [Limisphaerales bacterium]